MSEKNPRVARWSTGTSDKSLDRALSDQAILARGKLNDTDDDARYTPAGLSTSHYDALRMDRDDLDFREWNQDTGFSGVGRWPKAPGVAGQAGATTASERRRLRRKLELDEGF
jgi:hypothetical protein